MIENGKLTTNGWLFVFYLLLALTSIVNPFVMHRYLAVWWYPAVGIYGIWLLARILYPKGGAR